MSYFWSPRAEGTQNDKQELVGTNKHQVFTMVADGMFSPTQKSGPEYCPQNIPATQRRTSGPQWEKERSLRNQAQVEVGQLSLSTPESQTPDLSQRSLSRSLLPRKLHWENSNTDVFYLTKQSTLSKVRISTCRTLSIGKCFSYENKRRGVTKGR